MTTITITATLDQSTIDDTPSSLDESTIDDTPTALEQATIIAGATSSGGGAGKGGYEPST